MKPDAVAPLRMRTQRLWGTRFDTPRDVVRWLLQLTAPRVHALNAYYNKQHELDKKVFTKSNTLIAKALKGAHLRAARRTSPPNDDARA